MNKLVVIMGLKTGRNMDVNLVAHKGSSKVVNIGDNMGVNMDVNIGVNMLVNMGLNMDVNMFVDLKRGSTQMFKLNLTLFQHLEKKGDGLTDVHTD